MSTLLTNLQAFYNFNGNASDVSANNRGALTGTYTAGAAKFGTASASLASNQTLLNTANLWNITSATSFTIAFWHRAATGGGGTNTDIIGSSIEMGNFNLQHGAGTYFGFVGNARIIVGGSADWTHYTYVINVTGTTGSVDFYVNGVVARSLPITNWNFRDIDFSSRVTNGYTIYGGNTSNPLTRLIDSLGFWNRSLTQAEIRALQYTEFPFNPITGTISVNSPTFGYNGSQKTATVTTNPSDLSFTLQYNGSLVPPANAGSYTLLATITDPYFVPSQAAGTLTINKATPTVTVNSPTFTYDGTSKTVTVTTNPLGFPSTITYNGSTIAPTNAGIYSVEVVLSTDNPNYNIPPPVYSTLTINKATASIVITDTTQTYDGNPKSVNVITTPSNLGYSVTYNGSSTVPINAGQYSVVVTINDINYQGTANSILNINKAPAEVTIINDVVTYDGTQKSVSVFTTPSGLSNSVTYNGSITPPINANQYEVVATVNDPNYSGSSIGSLQINPSNVDIIISNTSQYYSGMPISVTVETIPNGVSCITKYNGSVTLPIEVGDYEVYSVPESSNYIGSASAILNIYTESAFIFISNTFQTYTGNPIHVTTETFPPELNVEVTYNGSTVAPTDVGFYIVEATIKNSPPYGGFSTDFLYIDPAEVTFSYSDLNQSFNGCPLFATVTTSPFSNATTDTIYTKVEDNPETGSYAFSQGKYEINSIAYGNFRGSGSAIFVVGDVNEPEIRPIPPTGWRYCNGDVVITAQTQYELYDSVLKYFIENNIPTCGYIQQVNAFLGTLKAQMSGKGKYQSWPDCNCCC